MTAMHACPGPCDEGVRSSGKYLCLSCWSDLPMPARRALSRRDAQAFARLRELHAQLQAATPLGEIAVSP